MSTKPNIPGRPAGQEQADFVTGETVTADKINAIYNFFIQKLNTEDFDGNFRIRLDAGIIQYRYGDDGVWTNVVDLSVVTDGLTIADITGLETALNEKQATLISGTNIKTINGTSILGAGNIVVDGGGGGVGVASVTGTGVNNTDPLNPVVVLSTAAVSGSYNDLINTPVIPSDVSDLTDTTFLLFDGTYASLSGKPTIPSDVSQLTDTGGLLDSAWENMSGNQNSILISGFNNDSGFETPAQLNARDTSNRSRANHTGTQLAATISDFDTEVANNSAVTANTAKITNATHTGDVTGATALTIANDVVTNAKLANVATATIKGRVTAATGDPEDLTATQVRTLINVADGATSNSSDASLRDRTTHTGEQLISTVTGLQTALDGKASSVHTHIHTDITDFDPEVTAIIAAEVAEPDLDQFIEHTDGRYRITKLHVTPSSAIVDFTTWGKIGATTLPVYDTFSFNEASIIEANADQLKTWVIIGSFNTVPSIISSPPAFLAGNITGTILTGYANLNRLVFELVMIDAVPKVNLVITQWAGANADPNAPDPDLLVFYKMDEAPADYATLFDSSSYGHDAINADIANTTRVAGVVGNQLEMISNISGSGFTVPHNADMDFSLGITVMGWVTLTTANLTNSCGIISKDSGVLGFSFFTETTALFRFHLAQESTASRVRSTTAAVADTPIHACATWDGTATKMYINGVLENTTPYAVALNQGTEPLNIAQTSISFKAGNKLDQARVFKRALSGAEILAIYNAENPV